MSASQQQQSSVFVMFAVFLALGCLLSTINAQMTFSDGWGKRSSAPFALLQRGSPQQKRDFGPLSAAGHGPVSEIFMGEEDDPAMDACHVGYAQRLVQLHEQMLSLYTTYQQCQAKALGKKAAHQKA